ncbi:hypothetical protein HYV86_05920 [Candidatus Woesearchaeota archaeon]|nr:hypothetical protein [Candidatus Woesearchaeota archaeon]
MNSLHKKGTVAFLIVFVIFASIGLFVVLNYKGMDEIPHVKGEWQYKYLEEYAYRAAKDQYVFEKKVLENSLLTQEKIYSTLPSHDTGCGTYASFARWNMKEKMCFPRIYDEFVEAMQQQLAQQVDREITLEQKNGVMVASMEHYLTAPRVEYLAPARIQSRPSATKIDPRSAPFWDTITPKAAFDTTAARKEYTTQLVSRVTLPTQLAELDAVFAQTAQLLSACRNQEDLKKCLDANRAQRWQYGNCNVPEFTSQGRDVLFCYVFFNSDQGYPFVLDFTPTNALPVTLSKVVQTAQGYTVHFPYDQDALSFTIYYTNVDSLVGYSGSASQIIVLEQTGQILGKEEFVNGPFIESCDAPQLHEPHICNNELRYLIAPVQPDTYYFAATRTKEKDESLINGFVGITE